MAGDVEVVHALLAKEGVDVDVAVTPFGLTPLTAAARHGSIGVASALVEAGADVNLAHDGCGYRAFYIQIYIYIHIHIYRYLFMYISISIYLYLYSYLYVIFIYVPRYVAETDGVVWTNGAQAHAADSRCGERRAWRGTR